MLFKRRRHNADTCQYKDMLEGGPKENTHTKTQKQPNNREELAKIKRTRNDKIVELADKRTRVLKQALLLFFFGFIIIQKYLMENIKRIRRKMKNIEKN